MLAVKKIIAAMVLCGAVISSVSAAPKVTVYAAASLTDVMTQLERQFERQYQMDVKTSYAASSTLAKQIAAGAPADVYISADEAWGNYLQSRQLLVPNKRVNLLGNRLVLISPKNQPIQVRMSKNFNLSKAYQGKLCTGNVQSVPVGRYAKQALMAMNWWNGMQSRLVETEDVRSALNFVARGECPLGIVYATDAAISRQVRVVGVFPLQSHAPIVYPLAMVRNNLQAAQFYQYLQTPAAKAVFKRYGFSVLQ